MIISALWSSNHDWSFDVEFLKLLVVINLFITNIKCNFIKEIICRKRVIIVFCPKIIFGATNKFLLIFFCNLKILVHS